MAAAIEVGDLRKRYDGVQALDGVSLSVPEVDPVWSLAVLSGVTAAVVALDVALFRCGYGPMN